MRSHQIALVDDHILLRKGLSEVINKFANYEVILQGNSGLDLIDAVRNGLQVDIALLDVNMPIFDGIKTAEELQKISPETKIIALSMIDAEDTIIRMLRAGARGYVLKDVEPSELKSALDDVITHGYHFSNIVSSKLVYNLLTNQNPVDPKKRIEILTAREKEFIILACSELTYKEIASKMNITAKSAESIRSSVFDKLELKSRVGLALYAMRCGFLLPK